MARLLYVHWNRDEALDIVRQLRAAGHVVRYEAKDGAVVWKKVKASPPDVLVVSLERLPSHGLRTAAVTLQVKRLADLPLLFVDGNTEAVTKARKIFPRASFTSATRLVDALKPSKQAAQR